MPSPALPPIVPPPSWEASGAAVVFIIFIGLGALVLFAVVRRVLTEPSESAGFGLPIFSASVRQLVGRMREGRPVRSTRSNPTMLVPSMDEYDDDAADHTGMSMSVQQRVGAWAEGRDFYELAAAFAAFGLQLNRASGDARASGATTPLDRDHATPEALACAWERVDGALSGAALEALPPAKRAVAVEIRKVVAAGYEAERIVVEEIGRAMDQLRKC